MLEEALRLLRGVGTEIESRVCGNLGSLYAVQGRRFEAILLWRRGQEISEALGLRLLTARHGANLCGSYAALDLWSVLREALQAFADRIESFPPEEQEGARELFLWPRVYLALHDQDLAAAETLVADFQRIHGDAEDPRTRSLSAAMRADLLAASGDREGAFEVLREAEAGPDLSLMDRVYVAYQSFHHLKEAGRLDEARQRAADLLEPMEALVHETGAGDLSITLTADLAGVLAGDPAYAEAARRALDLAGTGVLRCIAELDAAARRMPELCALPAHDVAWIAELRVAYQREQQALIQRVTELTDDPRGAPLLFHETGPREDGYIRICAWCSRVAVTNGRWLPIAHFLPGGYGAPVSHGICRDCRAVAWRPEETAT